MRRTQLTSCAGVAALLLALVGPVSSIQAEDFIRGDANGDGVVSLADSHFLNRFLFVSGSLPECMKSGDYNDDGRVLIDDGNGIYSYVLLGGAPPSSPFPAPGPDATEDGLACDSYGGGSALVDPTAEIRILDATAPGGDDQYAVITLGISNAVPVAAYSGAIRFDPTVISGTRNPTNLSGVSEQSFGSAHVLGNELRFGFLASITADPSAVIPPGENLAVLQIEVCLTEGTTAGEYPLTLVSGELVDADSARRIDPATRSATLTVQSDLDPGVGCRFVPLDNPPVNPEDVDALFKVGSGSGSRGATVDVPLILGSNAVIQGFSFSVDFDEEVLEGRSIDPVYALPSGEEYRFAVYTINNESDIPGNGGVDEGYLIGAVIFHFTDFSNALPPSEGTEVLNFKFNIRPDITETRTEIRFLDGGLAENGGPVVNNITVDHKAVDAEFANSFIFIDGFLQIVGDVSFFRGDSNRDQRINVSDGVHILNHLFLKGEEPGCMDAADADDSGDVNLADAVAVFGYLFSDGPSLPPPAFPICGADLTDDELPPCQLGAEVCE